MNMLNSPELKTPGLQDPFSSSGSGRSSPGCTWDKSDGEDATVPEA